MDALARLRYLSSQMDLEPAEDAVCQRLSARQQDAVAVSDAVLPNGKRIALLKTLLTSACERNCYYCPFRVGRDFQRTTMKPEEMAQAFMIMHRAGVAQGIFLSSGVTGGGIRTQDQILATAEVLRFNFGFKGYVHLKLMPGVEHAQVERAMQLADRVSLNLEAPNSERLERLAPRKAFFEELLKPLQWVEEIRRNQSMHLGWKGRWPSMSTQFVVGAVGESDLELLATTTYLYRNVHLARAYYSAFQPVQDTPFQDLPAASPTRELRLYQASFLLRDYGFDLEDLPFEISGSLPAHLDPKTAWAQVHLSNSPVEINRASCSELLRVPGIGPKGANAILAARRSGKIADLEGLSKIGVNPVRARPYILLNGKRPDQQLSFMF